MPIAPCRRIVLVLTSLLVARALHAGSATSLDHALADLEATAAGAPLEAAELLRTGNLRLENGDPAGAAVAFGRAIDLAPNLARAHERLGWVRAREGAYADALRHFTRALALAPDDHETWESRARAKRDAGFLLGAIEDYTQAAALAPGQAAPRRARGMVHFDVGAYDAAISDLRAACALDPARQDHTRVYLWLARAAGGDRAGASAELAAYHDARPRAGDRDWFPALAAFLLGTLDEVELMHVAADDGSDATRRTRLAEAHFCAGFVKLLDGARDDAAESFRRCVDTGMDESTAHMSAVAALGRLARDSVADAGRAPR